MGLCRAVWRGGGTCRKSSNCSSLLRRLSAISVNIFSNICRAATHLLRMGLGMLGKKKVIGMKEWSRSRYFCDISPDHLSRISGPSRHLSAREGREGGGGGGGYRVCEIARATRRRGRCDDSSDLMDCSETAVKRGAKGMAGTARGVVVWRDGKTGETGRRRELKTRRTVPRSA